MNKTLLILLLSLLISPFSAAQFADREQAFALILNWVQEHSGRIPRFKDFGRAPGKIPFNYRRLVAIGDFAPGAKRGHLALFSDPQEFWLAFYRYSREKGIAVRMLDLCLKTPPGAELQEILQTEALDRTMEWMIETGRPPHAIDFRSYGGTLDLDYEQVVGLRAYKNDEASFKVFSSTESFRRALKARWDESAKQQRESAHSVLGFEVLRRNAEQRTAMAAVLAWYQQNGRLPTSKEITASSFPYSYQKLVGNNAADLRKVRPLHSIFSTPEEFWLALKAYALEQGIELYLLNVSFVHASERLKQELRLEVNTLVLRWIRDHHGQLPKATDFGLDPGQIPIRYARLTAGSPYNPGGQARHLALHKDDQEFWRQFKAFAQREGLNVELSKVRFRGPLQEETKRLIEEEQCRSLMS